MTKKVCIKAVIWKPNIRVRLSGLSRLIINAKQILYLFLPPKNTELKFTFAVQQYLIYSNTCSFTLFIHRYMDGYYT